METVSRVLSASPPLFYSRSALQRFHSKLKLLKAELRQLNRIHFDNIPHRSKKAYERLCSLQTAALQNPCHQSFENVSAAMREWTYWADLQEKIYKQKSRITWLSLGDQNTTYFHRVVQSRVSKNAIRRLVTDQGEVISNIVEIKQAAVRHFQQFLQLNHEGVSIPSEPFMEDLLDFRCTEQQSALLVSPVSAEEIKVVVL